MKFTFLCMVSLALIAAMEMTGTSATPMFSKWHKKDKKVNDDAETVEFTRHGKNGWTYRTGNSEPKLFAPDEDDFQLNYEDLFGMDRYAAPNTKAHYSAPTKKRVATTFYDDEDSDDVFAAESFSSYAAKHPVASHSHRGVEKESSFSSPRLAHSRETKYGTAFLKAADAVNTEKTSASHKAASAGSSAVIGVVAVGSILLLATGGAMAYRRRTSSLKAGHAKLDAANARTNTGEFGSAVEPKVAEFETGQTVTIKTPYVSQRIDELTVEYGDQVLVRQIFSDGWALGEVIGTGNVGVFPLCMCSKQQSSASEEEVSTSH